MSSVADPTKWRVLPVEGELTLTGASKLREELLQLITDSGEATIVLDLTDVTFIDSTAIGVIIGARKRLATQRRQLWLAAPQEAVLRTLKLVALDKLIPIYESMDEAERVANELEMDRELD
jgi:anti-sigma B factor antagonist